MKNGLTRLKVQRLGSGAGRRDVVVGPPRRELGAPGAQALDQPIERRVARPKVVSRAEQRQHAPRFLGPSSAKQPARLPVGEHEEQDVALPGGAQPEVRQEIGRCRVPGEGVPAWPRDLGQARQPLDDAPQPFRHRLADEGFALDAARQRSEVATLPLVEPQRLREGIDRGLGRRGAFREADRADFGIRSPIWLGA